MTERYVPVSKLEEWYQRHIMSQQAAQALRELIATALTPETMTHAEMLATLKRCLEDDKPNTGETFEIQVDGGNTYTYSAATESEATRLFPRIQEQFLGHDVRIVHRHHLVPTAELSDRDHERDQRPPNQRTCDNCANAEISSTWEDSDGVDHPINPPHVACRKHKGIRNGYSLAGFGCADWKDRDHRRDTRKDP